VCALASKDMTTVQSSPVRILIADDHELMRRGLRSILATRPNWEVCGEAVDGSDAIEKTRLLRPDILVLDISMPRINGLEVARAVRRDYPGTQVVILSKYDESEMRPYAIEAGARGYVSKAEASRQLLSAIESVLADQPPVAKPQAN
jgi:DNA-binding NarL/FixJ family response regulator